MSAYIYISQKIHCKTVYIILLHYILPKSFKQYSKVPRKMAMHVFCYSTIYVILLTWGYSRLLFQSLTQVKTMLYICLTATERTVLKSGRQRMSCYTGDKISETFSCSLPWFSLLNLTIALPLAAVVLEAKQTF